MSESKKGELAIRDKALQHQQRRLKQATQFTHKDSADLLPLDGLKRMGTSKDLQPHSIVQRRLLEGNVTRLRGGGEAPRGGSPQRELNATSRCIIASSPLLLAENSKDEERSESTADDSTTTEEGGSAEEEEEEGGSPEEESSERSLRSDEEEEEDSEAAARAGRMSGKTEATHGPPRPTLTALLVQCKCFETDIKAAINTGSLHNHISSSCCRRLGLVPVQDSALCGLVNTVRGLQLQIGRQSVQCSAFVTEDEVFELCLGLHTLLELKCCVDLSTRMLKLQGSGEELPFLESTSDSRSHHHDTNENMGRAPLPSPSAL